MHDLALLRPPDEIADLRVLATRQAALLEPLVVAVSTLSRAADLVEQSRLFICAIDEPRAIELGRAGCTHAESLAELLLGARHDGVGLRHLRGSDRCGRRERAER